MRDLYPIEAARIPSHLRICGASAEFKMIEAEADPGGKPKLKKFSIVGYTGGLLRLGGWPYPVVVDLEGMSIPLQQIPTLKDHDVQATIGHTTSIEKSQKRLYLTGVMSGHSDTESTPSAIAAREVVRMATNDFQWQASIGAQPDKTQFVPAGETIKANGQNFGGPLYLVSKSTLAEISFVAIGADMNTTTSIAASAASNTGGLTVDFSQFLAAQGMTETAFTALPELAKTAIKAQHEAAKIPPPVVSPIADPVAEMRVAAAAESMRISGIRKVCAGGNSEIESKAISEGWDVSKAELEVLRAARPAAPFGFVITPPEVNSKVIEAATISSLGGDTKGYKEEVLEAAHKNFRNISLQQIILLAATSNGYQQSTGARINQSNLREVLQFAFAPAIKASSFSLPGILGPVANKQIVSGYMEEDNTWQEISRVVSASTFHDRTFYRLLDDMEYEEIGPDGEIKHGALGQESYTASLSTYAKMFSLDRKSIINDDLGAFDDLRTRLGRGAKKKFNNLFWTNMLASHSGFFTSGRGNYITGATTTLLTDGVGLGLGLKAFRTMKSATADGAKRVNARPSILMIPPELEGAADKLFMGEKLNVGSAGGGDENIYRNKYRPVVNAWLSDSAFTGYSATAWYLFRAPNDMPMMLVSFLNGTQTPTVESAEADFNTLGIQFRGYHDFYANQAEYLCGVKSKGAA